MGETKEVNEVEKEVKRRDNEGRNRRAKRCRNLERKIDDVDEEWMHFQASGEITWSEAIEERKKMAVNGGMRKLVS